MLSKIYKNYINCNCFLSFIRLVGYKLYNKRISLRAKLTGSNIHLGRNVSIPFCCTLSTQLGGRIVLGDNVSLGEFAQILTFGGDIIIGDNVSIGEFSILHGHGGLVIGNDCLIGPHTIFIPANHIFSNPGIPIRLQGETKKGIRIKDDVWIGSNVVILDGVAIEKGCVVGAGSVVAKSIPDYSVAVGVPARVVKDRRNKPG